METACDKNGWILGYTLRPGNLNDSLTFKGLYDKIRHIGIKTLIADAGYGCMRHKDPVTLFVCPKMI